MLNTVWVDELDDASVDDFRELLLAVGETSGRPEIRETGSLPPAFRGGQHLLTRRSGELVGYVHLNAAGDAAGRQVAELFVHPEHRNKGIGTTMVKALVAKADADVPKDTLRVWARGDHPAAAHLADREGFTRARELLMMRAEVAEWPQPVLRNGVTLRTFVPGQDERAVIDVNSRAFDWHPEQGRLTVEDLRVTEAEDWFDARGFFLAQDTEGQVIGFHWTKVHPTGAAGQRVGEVYVVGVAPDAQGGGLGRALTLAGLRYLAEQGLSQIILYVEGDNAPALAVYERLGFTRQAVDVQYAR